MEAYSLPSGRPRPRRRLLIAGVAAVCAAAVGGVAVGSSGGGDHAVRHQVAARPAAAPAPAPRPKHHPEQQPALKPHPRVVQALGPGQAPPASVTAGNGTVDSGSAPPSDAEVRQELDQFRSHLQGVGAPRGPVPRVLADGKAVAPESAPDVVAAVIAAGNEIATKPYKWGGGHGAWRDTGYDCSGSVSFALAGAGLLSSPLDSTRFMHWGAPGRGRWITIFANGGHAFMVVAGLRFDTSGAEGGTRWQPVNGRSYAGFVVRHPPGL